MLLNLRIIAFIGRLIGVGILAAGFAFVLELGPSLAAGFVKGFARGLTFLSVVLPGSAQRCAALLPIDYLPSVQERDLAFLQRLLFRDGELIKSRDNGSLSFFYGLLHANEINVPDGRGRSDSRGAVGRSRNRAGDHSISVAARLARRTKVFSLPGQRRRGHQHTADRREH